jgi:hypothetical protein
MTVTGVHRFMQTPLATVVLVALTASGHAEPAARAYSQAMAEGARQMAAKCEIHSIVNAETAAS